MDSNDVLKKIFALYESDPVLREEYTALIKGFSDHIGTIASFLTATGSPVESNYLWNWFLANSKLDERKVV